MTNLAKTKAKGTKVWGGIILEIALSSVFTCGYRIRQSNWLERKGVTDQGGQGASHPGVWTLFGPVGRHLRPAGSEQNDLAHDRHADTSSPSVCPGRLQVAGFLTSLALPSGLLLI